MKHVIDEGIPAFASPPRSRTRTEHRSRPQRFAVGLLVFADLCAIAVSIGLAYLLRQWIFGVAADLHGAVADSVLTIALVCLGAIIVFRGYDFRLVPSGPELFRNVILADVAAAGIIGAMVYLADIRLSRAYFVLFFLIAPGLLLLNRLLLRRIVNSMRANGRFRSRVVIVGSPAFMHGIYRTLCRESWLGYSIIGAVTPDGCPDASSLDVPVVGSEDELIRICQETDPDVLLFTAGSGASAEDFRRMAWQLEREDIKVIVVPALAEISADRLRLRPVAGLPLVHVDLPRALAAAKWTKRFFDILVAGCLLLLTSPVFLMAALVIRGHDGGSVIFRQQRVGRGGKPFTFFKFRSMVEDAELVRERLEAEQEWDSGNSIMFKMREDPRVTRPGRFLRRFSIDELPQLWNVLRGDMSLVGPRPALWDEVSAYDRDASRRLSVRPGITGLWQVSGRSDLSWSDTVRMDLYYVDNWSFFQDIQILIRTVRAVVAASGAY